MKDVFSAIKKYGSRPAINSLISNHTDWRWKTYLFWIGVALTAFPPLCWCWAMVRRASRGPTFSQWILSLQTTASNPSSAPPSKHFLNSPPTTWPAYSSKHFPTTELTLSAASFSASVTMMSALHISSTMTHRLQACLSRMTKGFEISLLDW